MYRENRTCESGGKCGYFKNELKTVTFHMLTCKKIPIFEINVPWSHHKKCLLEYYLADKVTQVINANDIQQKYNKNDRSCMKAANENKFQEEDSDEEKLESIGRE